MSDFPNIFICPACKSSALSALPESVSCQSCGAEYPVVQGMPILVRDPSAHEADMQRARDVNPEWYQAEQSPEEASPWRHHLKKRRLYVEGVLAAHLKRRGVARVPRLLDLGCGDGNNLKWLTQYADVAYGSDYNLVRLTRARHQTEGVELFLGDILSYPVLAETFDVIFFNHVLEHIGDDIAALKEVKRLLKPDGLLVLGVPNEGAWWWQLAYKRAPEVLAATDHVHFYTGKTVATRVREAGFSVSSIHHLGWGPPDWHLDGVWRQHKWVDDWFERIGRVVLPTQASSLYLVAEHAPA